MENLEEIAKRYRQIKRYVELDKREEALGCSVEEGLINLVQAEYLYGSRAQDFKKDYYMILDQQVDKMKVGLLLKGIEDIQEVEDDC